MGGSRTSVATESPFWQVAKSFVDFLEGFDLAGYNLMKYDLPVLEKEFEGRRFPFPFRGARWWI